MYISPAKDAVSDPISTVIQQPIIPVNDPMKASRSRSPSPIPCFFVAAVKSRPVIQKKVYPAIAPMALWRAEMGSAFSVPRTIPTGMRKSVAKRDMSMVSISDRTVTSSAEKKMLYPPQ